MRTPYIHKVPQSGDELIFKDGWKVTVECSCGVSDGDYLTFLTGGFWPRKRVRYCPARSSHSCVNVFTATGDDATFASFANISFTRLRELLTLEEVSKK